MAKLFSTAAEIRALRAMCSESDKLSNFMFGRVNVNDFHTEEGRECWNVVMDLMNRSGTMPRVAELIESPDLSEPTRELLSADTKDIRTRKEAERLVSTLYRYRKSRDLYKLTRDVAAELEAAVVKPDQLLNMMQERLARIVSHRSPGEVVLHQIGTDGNTDKLVKRMLTEEENLNVIPTGIRTFDDVNGGLMRGHVSIIAGATGSGKCLHPNTLIRLHGPSLISDTQQTHMSDLRYKVWLKDHLGGKPVSLMLPGGTSVIDEDDRHYFLFEFAVGFRFLPKGAYLVDNNIEVSTFRFHGLRIDRIETNPLTTIRYLFGMYAKGVKVSLVTDTGSSPIKSVMKSAKPLLRISTDKHSIIVSTEHKMAALAAESRRLNYPGRDKVLWAPADELRVGDYLFDESLEPVKILDIHSFVDESESKTDYFFYPFGLGNSECYDLELEQHHCFFANGLLSHNSMVSGQLALNQSRMGYRVGMVPLEMSTEEMIGRFLSNVSGIENKEIQNRNLTTKERKRIWQAWKKLDATIREHGGCITIFKPETDVNAQEVFSVLRPTNTDIIYIDYVNLLAGLDGERQWQKISEVGRTAKLYAEATNKHISLIAQLSEEGLIRYSRGLREHASTTWQFVQTPEGREQGILLIKMGKARGQKMMDFSVKYNEETQGIEDLPPSTATRSEEPTSNKGKRDDDDQYLPNLMDDD